MTKATERRDFIKKSALFTAGLAFTGTAASYSRIMGANDRVNIGMVGLRSRGKELTGSFLKAENTQLVGLCDVDNTVLQSRLTEVISFQKKKPKTEKDFRKLLELKELDAVVIASPDHTHTPFAIYAMQNDKHVYVEKPMSHNLEEGELLVAAQKKYGKVVQVGNQQRSAPTSIEAVNDIRQGIIGEVHTAKAWYSNNRGSIGIGSNTAVPEWLDWDLWQGPAPRKEYQDNIVHYNWHWFWHWGTGEINNNGLHELDVCRWALGVDTPLSVQSTGGRYYFKDDWEFYDTQQTTFKYQDNKVISWEGHSCNNKQFFDRGRGSLIYGTKGSILLDRNGYYAWDLSGKPIKESKELEQSATTEIVGGGPLVDFHVDNFLKGIRKGETLHSGAEEVSHSNRMCHLGNIAQSLQVELAVDPNSGKVLKNEQANQMRGRAYEPGWEPKL